MGCNQPEITTNIQQSNRVGAIGIVETSSRPLMLSFTVPGKIVYLANKGSTVQAGHTIASLDKSTLNADLNLLEIRKKRAMTILDRSKKINEESQIVAKDTLEEQQLAIDILTGEIDRLLTIKHQYDIIINIPVMILRYEKLVGEVCAPNDVVIYVAPATELRVRAEVESYFATKISINKRCEVEDDSGNKWNGHIENFDISLRPKSLTRNYPGEKTDVLVMDVYIKLDSYDNLLIGLPVDVVIN